MLTHEAVLEAVRHGRKSECLDGRDYQRLCDFFTVDQWEVFGFGLKEGGTPPVVHPWTHEAVVRQLGEDVAFGFEKALNKRGISASLMWDVVKMWLWILEDPLQYSEDYTNYGLPLLKAVSVKYGFPNPIGDDRGDESQYDEER